MGDLLAAIKSKLGQAADAGVNALDTVGYKLRYGMTPDEYSTWAAQQQVPASVGVNPNVRDRFLGQIAATQKGVFPDFLTKAANDYALGDYYLSPTERAQTKAAGQYGHDLGIAQRDLANLPAQSDLIRVK